MKLMLSSIAIILLLNGIIADSLLNSAYGQSNSSIEKIRQLANTASIQSGEAKKAAEIAKGYADIAQKFFHNVRHMLIGAKMYGANDAIVELAKVTVDECKRWVDKVRTEVDTAKRAAYEAGKASIKAQELANSVKREDSKNAQAEADRARTHAAEAQRASNTAKGYYDQALTKVNDAKKMTDEIKKIVDQNKKKSK